MAALRLCSLLIVALTAAQYCMLHAAPTQDLSNVNRNFRTGSLITERYALVSYPLCQLITANYGGMTDT